MTSNNIMKKTTRQLAEELTDKLLELDRIKVLLRSIVNESTFDGGGHVTKRNPPTHSQLLKAKRMVV